MPAMETIALTWSVIHFNPLGYRSCRGVKTPEGPGIIKPLILQAPIEQRERTDRRIYLNKLLDALQKVHPSYFIPNLFGDYPGQFFDEITTGEGIHLLSKL